MLHKKFSQTDLPVTWMQIATNKIHNQYLPRDETGLMKIRMRMGMKDSPKSMATSTFPDLGSNYFLNITLLRL